MRNSGQLIDFNGGPGFEWPNGSFHHVIYTGGLWIAGKVNDTLRIAAVQYDTSCFQPGIMQTRFISNPTDSSFRFYTIRQSDTAGVPDFDSWPDSQGAPTQYGLPLKKGGENIFCVYNDGRIVGREFHTKSLGVEVEQYVYGDSITGDVFNNPPNNTVYAEFRIANRDTLDIDSAYISLWLDPDIGESTDDVTGVDTSLALAYCYNGRATDAEYGTTPPAVGLLVLRSPDGFVPPVVPHSFVSYNPSLPSTFSYPDSTPQAYNYLRGYKKNGAPIIDPSTALPTLFMYSGDPVANTGWVDTTAEEKAFLFSFGPFTLAAGDSTEFHIALFVAQGTDRLNSVTLLKQAVPTVIQNYTSKLVSVRQTTVLPADFELFQNFPNPFNPTSTIQYNLPHSAHVILRVYNTLGQLVATLVDAVQTAGVQSVQFNAGSISSGVYFYRLQTEIYSFTKKMVVIK